MTFNIAKHKNEFLFLPLGGSGEIGMNLNLYHYQGKWLMVDLGAGFADDYLPGIDMIVPDIHFILKHRSNLVGIVLTHAHEDHLGAVQYLWNELHCPIYTTPFTAAFLRAKLAEMPFASEVKITEVPCAGSFELEPFTIDMLPLTHSAPEMQAVIIRTELGSVMHTGDWKFDPDPLIGEAADEARLKAYGDAGILAMVGDSTNVFNPGTSGSEGDLRKSLIELVANCKKMVAVTTFASNVARIETIARAAEACGRHVIMAGRSLWRIVRAAKESGYLQDIEFLEDSQIGKFPRDKVLVICTGCQGEPMAATTKIANGAHPTVKLNPGDTVIFSSKIIPGNDKKIFRLFNQLVKQNVEVLTEKDHFVHVSGHPGREELHRMVKLLRPEIMIPVHGELVHIHEHCKLAKEWGVPQTVQLGNGDVIRLAPGKAERVGVVEAGYLGIDGHYLLPPDSPVLRMRRKIQRDGVIVVNLIMGKTGALRTDPLIIAPGCLDAQEDKEILSLMVEEVRDVIEQSSQAIKTKQKDDHLYSLTRSAIRRIVKREVGKNPPIEIHIEVI